MSVRLKSVTIRGFKTIAALDEFSPRPLNVLIGPNGAGKSNFVSFFRLLSWMLAPPGGLQEYVARAGGASALLHDGPETTREIEARLTLETESGDNDYACRLAYAAGDTLIFTEEKFRFSDRSFETLAPWRSLDAGHREARLVAEAESGDTTARTILNLLRKCVVHQFHNTSLTSRMRQKWAAEDSRFLKEDGANLAPFLRRLQEDKPAYYRRIVETLRLLLPFFADFELETQNGKLLLQWREQGCDVVFDASQASDGMLRTMALVALLAQPPQDLPAVLILDEPELGLHPYAIEVVAGLIKTASQHTQVLVATQSAPLVDYFEPEDIVVVERRGRESVFQRLEGDALQEWLQDYSLSELWEKNVIGGRPGR